MLKWMMKMKREKNRKGSNLKNKKIYINILLVFSIALFIFSGIKIALWLRDNKKSKENLDETIDIADIKETDGENVEKVNPPAEEDTKYSNDYFYYMSLPFLSVGFDELNAKNSDTVAWLKVAGTKVNYPVVQTNNNDYYLTHAFDKTVNEAGWLFADYRSNLDEFR